MKSNSPVSNPHLLTILADEVLDRAFVETYIRLRCPQTHAYSEQCRRQLELNFDNAPPHVPDALNGAGGEVLSLPKPRRITKKRGAERGVAGYVRSAILAYAQERGSTINGTDFKNWEEARTGQKVSTGTLYGALGHMMSDGLVKKLGAGTYQVVASPPSQAAQQDLASPRIDTTVSGTWTQIFNQVADAKGGQFSLDDVKQMMHWEKVPHPCYSALRMEVHKKNLVRVSPGTYRRAAKSRAATA